MSDGHPVDRVDVAIVGGGPAGAATATRLARWGYSVVLLSKPPTPRSCAESLPPSIVKPLSALDMDRAVRDGSFYRSRGNTVWWGPTAGEEGRSEPFANGGLGYQVLRSAFDRVLLDEAASAGVVVWSNATVRAVDLEASSPRLTYDVDRRGRATLAARFVLDCSGRAGVVARRGHRVTHPYPPTVALIGRWGCDAGWKVPDASHTLVESYADGWAWSVPVSATVRDVTVMVDPRTTGLHRTGRVEQTYHAEVAKTRRLAALTRDAVLLCAPWGRDATQYSARRHGGDGFLLVGDASSAVDPLSSFGVRKALTSAWLAAVVTRTRLRHPERDAAALALFARRERELFAAAHRRAVDYFTDVSRSAPHPFWVDRAEDEESERGEREGEIETLRSDPLVRRALESLQRASSIDLRVTPAVTRTTQPAVRDQEVVLEPCIVIDGWPASRDGLRFLRAVDLPRLLSLCGSFRQVPDLFEAYCADAGAVPLEDFLGALAALAAKGAVHNRAGDALRNLGE